MKKKISVKELAYTLTESDVTNAIEQEKIRIMLGIYTTYDAVQSNNHNNYVPSMYSSLDEYELDKGEADNYIYNNKPVPKQLEQKLIAARIELENKGLLQRYKGK